MSQNIKCPFHIFKNMFYFNFLKIKWNTYLDNKNFVLPHLAIIVKIKCAAIWERTQR